jgi:hypothetical protein
MELELPDSDAEVREARDAAGKSFALAFISLLCCVLVAPWAMLKGWQAFKLCRERKVSGFSSMYALTAIAISGGVLTLWAWRILVQIASG